MDGLKVLSFSEKFKLKKDQQFTIRLHDHGLLRLIPLSVDDELLQVTDKIFFHTLLNSGTYQELFFDHFSQNDWDYSQILMSFGLGFYDWTHSNAIWYDEYDNAVYLSVRYLNRITKIDLGFLRIIF